MKILNHAIVLLLISIVAGCGQPLVQFLDLSASHDLATPTEDLAASDLAVGDLARADLAPSGGDDGGQPTAPQVVATNPGADATSICVPPIPAVVEALVTVKGVESVVVAPT